MKKFILISALIAALASGSYAQTGQDTPGLRISLLTCTQGNDVASAFGHSAIRVTDSLHNMDLVFNYGTFSFQEPHFMLKFMHGDLNYFLSANSFQNFRRSYTASGRGIYEQVLDLLPEQAEQLYSFLLWNIEPENRYYLYDFLDDNCATRIRDIFTKSGFTFSDSAMDVTYRDELRRMLEKKYWMKFGVDLLLGAKIDRDITAYESMFLPNRLCENVQMYSNGMTGRPLAGAPATIAEAAQGHGKSMDILLKAVSPVSVFSILAVVYILVFLRGKVHRFRFARVTSIVLYSILGIGGIILSYMWFGTNHVWTGWNWNLLWMNPLFLIPVFMPSCKARNMIAAVLTALAVVPVFWFIPMTLNLASVILIIFTVLVTCSMHAVYVNR